MLLILISIVLPVLLALFLHFFVPGWVVFLGVALWGVWKVIKWFGKVVCNIILSLCTVGSVVLDFLLGVPVIGTVLTTTGCLVNKFFHKPILISVLIVIGLIISTINTGVLWQGVLF